MRNLRKKFFTFHFSLSESGQMLVELLLAIGISSIFLPALLTGLVASREGKAQQSQRMQAVSLLKEAEVAVKGVRNNGWSNFATNGTYHPAISGTTWSLASGAETLNGFARQVVISNVYRDSSGAIVSTGGTLDPSTKKVEISVGWDEPYSSALSSTLYLTRTSPNFSYIETSEADFTPGSRFQTQITNEGGGLVKLESNKAKWCSPSFANTVIDLPDGPPVAVSAKAASAITTPNDVFVATAPSQSSTTKLAYITVAANADPPTAALQGKFTMDSSQYTSGTFPSGTGLDNNFKTNDVKYYTSPAGKLYALLATDLPEKEVIAVQINDGSGQAYQDATNKIYKYWTYFNTKVFPTVSYNSPHTNAADTGGDNNGYASNSSNAYIQDDAFAVDSNSGSGTGTSCTGTDKDKHLYYDYDFSVPSGATINGIDINLRARADSTSNSPQLCVQLSWDGGTTWTSAKSTTTLTTSSASYNLGGSSDTWGRTWTNTDFSNANFRVRVINVASSTSRDFSLDFIGAKIYYNGTSTAPNDQAPHDYGATTLTVLGNNGYVASGGYLYIFDLSTIDSKSPTDGLDQKGCRIELDGYDCKPGSPGIDKKYVAGETGAGWSSSTTPAHNDCSDGGNIELYATNDLSGVQVSGSNYIFVAIGAGTNPEFGIINVTDIPDTNTSPSISSPSCGRISGGSSGWKRVSTYDFNSNSGTEEASNSVYAKSDGTRAYISSNGTSDSKQFYILNTSNKSSPSFLSGSSSSGPSSGFYQSSGANGELYPRRSLTVLDGKRAVLVGKDGVTNSNNAQEYQVLDMNTAPNSESSPGYCGGLDFDTGFNDLTSVSEADGDNFVYMVANGTSNELKIIQGGPDQEYLSSGTYESKTFDAGSSVSFNRILANVLQPGNTSIRFQLAVSPQVSGSCSGVSPYPFVGPDGTADTYFTAAGTSISGAFPFGSYLSNTYQNPGNCFRYKAFLTASSDSNQTPLLYDISWNYSQ